MKIRNSEMIEDKNIVRPSDNKVTIFTNKMTVGVYYKAQLGGDMFVYLKDKRGFINVYSVGDIV